MHKKGSIIEFIRSHAEKVPNKLCISDAETDISYKQFFELCIKYANFFKDYGVCTGDYVVVECLQRKEFLAIEFGLQFIGAIFVPVERKCPLAKMVSVADFCNAKAIVIANGTWRQDNNYEIITYDKIRQQTISSREKIFNDTMPDTNSVSEILFSTGTTGREKGIVLTHANDVACAENIIHGTGMKTDNVEIIPSPLNHSHGLRSFYANMISGASVVFIDELFLLNHFFDSIEKYNVNSMDLVPSALELILHLSGDKLGQYKHQIRFIEFGSAPLTSDNREKIKKLMPDVPLFNFYGSTESGRVTVCNFNIPDHKAGNIGKPTKNAEIFVVDENHNPIKSSSDHPGLLACRGPMNMIGYLNDPEETEKAMKDGIVYTEDEAYIDPSGDIILLGRQGEVINIGGRKLAPEEIENVALRIPEILDCACIAKKDEISGHVPMLLVVLKPGSSLDSKAIIKHIGKYLEDYKVPKTIKEIKHIPRTFNGKIIRKNLKYYE